MNSEKEKRPSAICHLWSLGFSITFYASFLSSLFLHEMILVFTIKGSSWEPTDSFSKKGLFIGSEIFFQHRHSLVICALKKRWKNASCHEEETKGDTACYFGLHKKDPDQFYLYIYNNDDEAEESSTTALLRIFLTSKTTIFQNVTS